MQFNLRKTICTVGGTLAMVAFLGNTAYALKRSCNGAYVAEYKTASGQIGKLTFGGIQATGGCGRLVPNRCRERARNALLKCMEKHEFANKPSTPIECTSKNRVRKYPYKNIAIGTKIFQDVAKISGGKLPTKVYAVSSGRRVCNATKILFPG